MSSSESVCGCDEAPSGRSAQPQRKVRRRVRNKGPGVSDVDDAASAGSRRVQDFSKSNIPRCHLCLAELKSTDLIRELKGFRFHGEGCFPAVRCHRRLFDKNLEECNRRMVQDPEAWREEVAPLNKRESSRDNAHKMMLKSQIQTSSTYTKKEERKQRSVMNKRHFKRHKEQWDNMGSVSASEEFDRIHEEQKGEFDSDGEECIAVKMHTLLMDISGTSKSNERQHPLDESNDGVEEGRRRRSRGNGAPSSRRNRDAHCGRKRSRSRNERHRRPTATVTGVASAVRVPRPRAASSSDERGEPKQSGGKQRLTEAALRQLSRDESGSQCGSIAGKSTTATSRCATKSGKPSPVEFMQRRQAMKDDLLKRELRQDEDVHPLCHQGVCCETH